MPHVSPSDAQSDGSRRLARRLVAADIGNIWKRVAQAQQTDWDDAADTLANADGTTRYQRPSARAQAQHGNTNRGTGERMAPAQVLPVPRKRHMFAEFTPPDEQERSPRSQREVDASVSHDLFSRLFTSEAASVVSPSAPILPTAPSCDGGPVVSVLLACSPIAFRRFALLHRTRCALHASGLQRAQILRQQRSAACGNSFAVFPRDRLHLARARTLQGALVHIWVAFHQFYTESTNLGPAWPNLGRICLDTCRARPHLGGFDVRARFGHILFAMTGRE